MPILLEKRILLYFFLTNIQHVTAGEVPRERKYVFVIKGFRYIMVLFHTSHWFDEYEVDMRFDEYQVFAAI